ncbi:MAG: hypothetical protein H6858_03815 [Rhodospirillales bacterium]|nr:hypothetical protein [Alphaproteobacteria bacterium]MCB9976712.1 hypothetical protein [Rhodospirillales bacterium]
MSIFRIFTALILALIIIGFGYLVIVDVPIRQTDVTKTLPKEIYTHEE